MLRRGRVIIRLTRAEGRVADVQDFPSGSPVRRESARRFLARVPRRGGVAHRQDPSLRYSLRGLAAADEPKPEEAAADEGKSGRFVDRCRGECEGIYSVICYGVTAHVVRIIVGTAVAPNVRLLARNREQDAR